MHRHKKGIRLSKKSNCVSCPKCQASPLTSKENKCSCLVFLPERLATPLAFSLSSTWHFFLAILWRMEAFSRNLPAKIIARVVIEGTERCKPQRLRSLLASTQSALLCHLWPLKDHISKGAVQAGQGITQNCHWHKINSQYNSAYHILMILQCPGRERSAPWSSDRLVFSFRSWFKNSQEMLVERLVRKPKARNGLAGDSYSFISSLG